MRKPQEPSPQKGVRKTPVPRPELHANHHDSLPDISVLDVLGPKQKKARTKSRDVKTRVAVIMGSLSDHSVMEAATKILDRFDVPYHVEVISAHRTPMRVHRFAATAREEGFRVIIAGAGGAAHLPAMVAAHTTLPVIGVPVPTRNLGGQDSLYSIVQMPAGVPVATVSIGGAENAAILALEILSTTSTRITDLLTTFKEQLEEKVEIMNSQLADRYATGASADKPQPKPE